MNSYTPMYLTTRPNRAHARSIDLPRELTGNVYVDPDEGKEVLIAFLRSLGIDIEGMPEERWQGPPTEGEGVILIVTRKDGGGFNLAAWEFIPSGENPMTHSSPLMPESI